VFTGSVANNIVEQDHRFIKKITKPMMGFKAFHSAQATIAGIETAHMIRKGQLSEENLMQRLGIF
jgi:putative transposase